MVAEPRNTGIDVVGHVPWGSHLCLFYLTQADLFAALIPYFRAGLASRERCLWVISAPLTEKEAMRALTQAAPELASAVEIVSHAEWYRPGGTLDLSNALASWIRTHDEAIALGRSGLRVAAVVSWLEKEDWPSFRDYEAELNRGIDNRKTLLLCAYPLATSRAVEVLDAARTHQMAVTVRNGAWEAVETTALTRARREIEKVSRDLDERVTERTRQLASLNEQLRNEILERKQAEAEGARHAAQLRALAEASVQINALISLDDLLRLTTEKSRAVIGAHQAVIALTVDESFAQMVHSVSLSDRYAAYRSFQARPDGSGIYSLVCKHNEPMRLTQEELEAHPAWRGFGKYAGQHPPLRGLLAAPLISRGGRNLGLIQLSDRDEGDFTEADQAILVQLAQTASVAIENARLFDEITRARERLRGLSRKLVEVQEEERRHIARELHDEIGQALTAIKINLQALRSASEARETPGIDESIGMAERGLQQVRDLSLDLRPSLLDDLGLVAALRWHLDRQAQRAPMKVHFASDLDGRLPAEIETVCFRVAQEALTNTLRHARAQNLWVELRARDDEIQLSIRDDGIGLDVANARQRALDGESLGLLGMQERVALVGGRLDIDSKPERGTEIRVSLPIVLRNESEHAGDEVP